MMGDIVDQAKYAEDLFVTLSRRAVAQAAPTLPAKGVCYNCQADVHGRDRFCDAECRDDYAYRKAAEQRRGIIRHG